MFYENLLDQMLKEEKNPVNSMYLNELKIKWNNFYKIVNEEPGNNEVMVKALNSFIKTTSNRKYQFRVVTNKGFKRDSHIYFADYLNDMISVIMKRKKIMKNKGISWGYQPFSYKFKFNPVNLFDLAEKPNYNVADSVNILQLVQKMDFQYRISGKRNFEKFKISIPLIQFYIYKNLVEENLVNAEYYSYLAKKTYGISKSIIVCETIDPDFQLNLASSTVDVVYVLRKQCADSEVEDISLDTVNALEEKIDQYLQEEKTTLSEMIERGIIE
ncbi:MAG TPA: hypothetical protein ENL20_05655 [Candidatus Cloacimonetes bacterium]|nr:hypothetical protein [Candidatus Cloacimonadota bacterium]